MRHCTEQESRRRLLTIAAVTRFGSMGDWKRWMEVVCAAALILLAAWPLRASDDAVSAEDAAAILQRVAERQQESLEARRRWIYQQQVMVRLFRSKNRLAREEVRDFRVLPQADGVEREMTSFAGKVEIDGKEYPYADPAYRTGDIDLDGEIAESLADDIGGAKENKDGVDDDLFPLSGRMMERHQFTLEGAESYRGREVLKFTFKPKKGPDGERGFWEGEMLVDRKSLAPVLVVTHQARGVPIVIRTMLGSNVKKLGFKLEYAEMEDGVWFPVSYSGEFSLRVLFGYGRTIALSLRNSGFQRASAETEIRYDLPPAEESPGAP